MAKIICGHVLHVANRLISDDRVIAQADVFSYSENNMVADPLLPARLAFWGVDAAAEDASPARSVAQLGTDSRTSFHAVLAAWLRCPEAAAEQLFVAMQPNAQEMVVQAYRRQMMGHHILQRRRQGQGDTGWRPLSHRASGAQPAAPGGAEQGQQAQAQLVNELDAEDDEVLEDGMPLDEDGAPLDEAALAALPLDELAATLGALPPGAQPGGADGAAQGQEAAGGAAAEEGGGLPGALLGGLAEALEVGALLLVDQDDADWAEDWAEVRHPLAKAAGLYAKVCALPLLPASDSAGHLVRV